MPTPRSRPQVTPTRKPTATATPTARPQPAPASDREGVWAGRVERPGPATHWFPWVALRITPGESPDVDPWRLEGGPVSLPAFECQPQRLEEGWQLGDCVGVQATVFVPGEGESGLKIQLQHENRDSDTITLARLPQRDEPIASANVSLLWHQPGHGIHADIWAAEGLVFAPHFSSPDIEILDTTTGSILGTARLPESEGQETDSAWDVKARDGLLYAATPLSGLVVFDVSQPTAPELIGQYRVFVEESPLENFTNIHNIFLSPDGGLVYAINTSGGIYSDLRIIDVSDPTSPIEAGRFSIEAKADWTSADTIFQVHDVNVIEREGRLIAFLNYAAAGLWILDVTDARSIEVLSSIEWDGIFSHSGWPFPRNGKLYYAHASEGYDRHLTILEVTDLTDPQVISRFSTRAGLSVHNIEVLDGIAYVSYYIDGLRVVDLRDPENPKEVGHFDTVPAQDERDIVQGLWGVHVDDGVVYASDFETGTYAFEVDLN